jgi:UrcA family protein
MTNFTIFAAALAASGAAVQAPVNVDASRSAVVQIGDLDLASDHGKSVLKHRIASAIEEVCGSYANVTDWNELESIDACRASAKQSADQQLAARSDMLKLAGDDRR